MLNLRRSVLNISLGGTALFVLSSAVAQFDGDLPVLEEKPKVERLEKIVELPAGTIIQIDAVKLAAARQNIQNFKYTYGTGTKKSKHGFTNGVKIDCTLLPKHSKVRNIEGKLNKNEQYFSLATLNDPDAVSRLTPGAGEQEQTEETYVLHKLANLYQPALPKENSGKEISKENNYKEAPKAKMAAAEAKPKKEKLAKTNSTAAFMNDLDTHMEQAKLSKRVREKLRGYVKNKILPLVPLLRAMEFFNKISKDKKVKERGMNEDTLAFSDLTRANDRHRLFLLDLTNGQLKKYKTGHGNGKELENDRKCANYFSHVDDTNLSGGGGYLTRLDHNGAAVEYRDVDGKVTGKAEKQRIIVRIEGMEKENEDVFNRGIYIHDAWYTTDVSSGTSHGCITLPRTADRAEAKDFVERTKVRSGNQYGSVVYVYPNESDLQSRTYWDPQCKKILDKADRTPAYIKQAAK